MTSATASQKAACATSKVRGPSGPAGVTAPRDGTRIDLGPPCHTQEKKWLLQTKPVTRQLQKTTRVVFPSPEQVVCVILLFPFVVFFKLYLLYPA